MIRLFVLVEDITAVMAAGYDTIRVYTDTSSTGTFVTLDGTITLVAATESYEYTDLDGVSTTWYKTVYYGDAPGLGDKSDARKGDTSAAYATVNELRLMVGITGESDDVEIAQILDGSARAINRFCNRPDGFMADAVASARYYCGNGGPYMLIDETVAITTVAVKDSASDTTYTAWTTPTTNMAGDGDWMAATGSPDRPDFNSLPRTLLIVDPNGDESKFTSGKYIGRSGFRPSHTVSRGTPTVQVTARWGYSDAVPYDINMANLMQAARWYKLLQGTMARTLATPELGTLTYPGTIDPDVQGILLNGRYIRIPIA